MVIRVMVDRAQAGDEYCVGRPPLALDMTPHPAPAPQLGVGSIRRVSDFGTTHFGLDRELKRLTRRRTAPYAEVVRAKILLMAYEHPDWSNAAIARAVGGPDWRVR
jgi:hypothetical protein